MGNIRNALRTDMEKKLPGKLLKILKNKKLYKSLLIMEIILILIYLILMYLANNYVINMTPSVKLGVYKIHKIKENEEIRRGELIIYEIPEQMQKLSTLKGTKIPSMKPVAAFYGDTIEIKNSRIYINGEDYGKIVENSKLPKFNGELKEDEVLTLSKVENTFDGRYYGGIKKEKIKWKAELVYEIRKQ